MGTNYFLKNPNWVEDELILVLNLYVNNGFKWINSVTINTEEIINMSNILKKLNIHDEKIISNSNFRSPSSVHMKLMNFRGLDPRFNSNGLSNSSKLDKIVWEKYSSDHSMLSNEVNRIYIKYNINDKNKSNNDNKLVIEIENLIKNLDELIVLTNNMECAATNIQEVELSQKIINYIDGNIEFYQNNIIQLKAILKEIRNPKLTSFYCDETIINNYNPIKIGKYVWESFNNLVRNNKLTNVEINSLLDEIYSRNTFHIGYPFLKKIDGRATIKQQMMVGSYQRYWKSVIRIFNEDYIVCKEWYESNRFFYNKWLVKYQDCNSINFANEKEDKDQGEKGNVVISCSHSTIKLSKQLVVDILKTIKQYDQEEIYIDMSKLNKRLKLSVLNRSNYKNANFVLNTIMKLLLELKIIVHFQNSKRCKYVIEDYETLAKIIDNPNILNKKHEGIVINEIN